MLTQVLLIMVGGLLALAGQYLTSHLTGKRDLEKWNRDEQSRFRRELFDVYSNCLALLTTIIVDCRLNPGEAIYGDEDVPESVRFVRQSLTDDEKLHRQEALKFLWLLFLQLNPSDPDVAEFRSDIEAFAEHFRDPDQSEPYYLRQHILKLARKDARLHVA